MSYRQLCVQCEKPFESRRPEAETCSDPCNLRKQGISGNPSQRATDIEEKYGVVVDRVWEKRGDRRGKRFMLTGRSASPPSGPLAGATSGESSDGEPAIAMAPPTSSEPARPSFLDPDVEWGSAA